MKNKIHALHGFLGRPSDWDFLEARSDLGADLEKTDIFQTLSPASHLDMMDWARAFNEKVAAQSAENEKRIILGYSMGGRLALHTLVRNPSLWSGAVIVSANPGPLDEERAPRLVNDEAWARRFESERWEDVVSAWEGHPVFGGKPIPFIRHEAEFRREDLAGAFRAWSLGRQENLTPRLATLGLPILWIVGEQDLRYVEIARRVHAQAPQAPIEFVTVADSGHRVPWEQPEVFKQHFSSFLRRVF